MTHSPDVSILIVNWNSMEFLRKCLASIHRGTRGLEFEVIVIDNASFDGAGAMVAAEFPDVHFIQSETNLGFARANNLAFEHSSGRVVLLLNPDTEIIDDAISTMFAALSKLKDAGIVGCRLLNSDFSVQTQCIKRFPTILADVLGIEWLRLKWPHSKLWSIHPLFSHSPDPVLVDAVCGACQMMPRHVYHSLGGLNTEYFMYVEDIEVSAAALLKGWKTYYVGNAKIVHHGGKSSQGSDRGECWVSIMQRQSIWQFYRKWRGTNYAALYRAVIGVVSLLWLFGATISSPVFILLRRPNTVRRIWHKWSGALQWSVAFERVTPKFRGQVARQSLLTDHMVSTANICPEGDSGTAAGSLPRDRMQSWGAVRTARSAQTGAQRCKFGHRINKSASQVGHRCTTASYVLMTAAYNEETHIAKTIDSVLSQTKTPKRWVIVSDGSLDRTDDIIRPYASKYDFIKFLRIERSPGRNFRSKVIALRNASKLFGDDTFDFIGNLDADISVGSSYFEDLLARFDMKPDLGLAAGFVCERKGEGYESARDNRVYSVAHGAQLIRRECYEAIGGYAVLEFGGEDWHAEISARMRGWTAEAFPDLRIFHHRPRGGADNLLRDRFRQGRMDHSLGSDPLFEGFKCLQRVPEQPFFIGAVARLTGFTWSCLGRDPRPVNDQFITFLRGDQRDRLKSLFLWKSLFSIRNAQSKSH